MCKIIFHILYTSLNPELYKWCPCVTFLECAVTNVQVSAGDKISQRESVDKNYSCLDCQQALQIITYRNLFRLFMDVKNEFEPNLLYLRGHPYIT